MSARNRINALMAWTVLAVLLSSLCAPVSAAPLRVRGVPEFQALRTQPTADGGYQVVGFLRGGFDQPLGGVAVRLLAPEGRPCEPGMNETGSQGEFCFRVRAATGSTAVLASLATEYLEEARAEVVLDPSRSHFRLTLELGTTEFDLGEPNHRVELRLETGTGNEPFPVRLRVSDGNATPERVRHEQHVSVSDARPAKVDLDSAALGGAGPVTLVADISIAGRELARTERSVTLTDTAEVRLAAPLEAVRPTLGFEVTVAARGRAGDVTSGFIEAMVGDTQVGVARVVQGRAVVPVRFQPGRRTRVPMSLRYVPEQPWYRAGPALETTLDILPTPLWTHAPWVALAALAAFWIIRAWRRPGRKSEAKDRTDPSLAGAEAVLLRRDRNATAWTGRVVDAHTGRPVADAQVSIEIPAVLRVETLREARSDADGNFELERLSPLAEAARLVVRAFAYTELRQAVPPLGRLQISIVERRRNLLQSLTRWAKAMGRPWANDVEPTPAHVAHVATQHERLDTTSWAREIEHAAYGPEAPTDAVESALVSRTPPLDPGPQHKR